VTTKASRPGRQLPGSRKGRFHDLGKAPPTGTKIRDPFSGGNNSLFDSGRAV